MPKKCSVGNCRGNYTSESEKVTVFSFPTDENERKRWLNALPNIIPPEHVTKNMGVCCRHWPPDARTKSVKGHKIPIDPPELFDVPQTFVKQVQSRDRDVDSRRISFEIRSSQPDELEEFIKKDSFNSFEDLLDGLKYRDEFIKYSFQTVLDDGNLYLIKLDVIQNSPEVQFYLRITKNFNVGAFRFNTAVPLRDLLGFQCRLTRFSQLDAIILRTKDYCLCPNDELKSTSKMLCSRLSDSEVDCDFLLEQLDLLCTPSNGRRYSAKTMSISLKLYMCSRSCYRSLREVITLPHPNTLTANIGSIVTLGSENEANYTAKLVFERLTGLQKKCLLLFDEVYIKPSIR